MDEGIVQFYHSVSTAVWETVSLTTVLRLHSIPASVHMWQESTVKVSSLHIPALLDEFSLLRPSTPTDMCVGVGVLL